MALKTVKKIDIISTAKVYGVITAIAGFFVGLGIAVFGSMMSYAALMGAGTMAPQMSILGGLGALAIIVMPIMYGVLGFIIGAIGAFIYNLIADHVGGIQIELE